MEQPVSTPGEQQQARAEVAGTATETTRRRSRFAEVSAERFPSRKGILQVIIYYPTANDVGKNIEKIARRIGDMERVRVFHDPERLGTFYAQSDRRDSAMVIVVEHVHDMHWFQESRSLLSGIKIIVVLCHYSDDMVREAFSLSPSYITSGLGDLSDVAAVLEKLKLNFNEFG